MEPVLALTSSWVMKACVGNPSSFWMTSSVHCVRHQRRGKQADQCIFWKLHWFGYHVLGMSLQWCTILQISHVDWSKLSLIYLPHHVEHGLMEEMIEEPDARLAGIFLEGNGIAVHDFYIVVIDGSYLSKQVPKSAPMTRLFLCLILTLLKWSTIDRSTRGWTLVWVMGALLII